MPREMILSPSSELSSSISRPSSDRGSIAFTMWAMDVPLVPLSMPPACDLALWYAAGITRAFHDETTIDHKKFGKPPRSSAREL